MKFRILIVDDEEYIVDGIKKIVDDSGFFEPAEVTTDPFEAERMIRDGNFDLAITDVRMEGENGFEMIENVKKFNADIRFIILTAYCDYEFMRRALKIGVEDYVLKPINKKNFLVILQKIKDDLDEHYANKKVTGEEASEKQTENAETTAGDNPLPEKFRGNAKMREALLYINKHYNEKLNLAYVANLVDLNYFYFSRNFKKEVGVTFLEYVTEKRMKEAIKLLDDPSLKIYEISDMLGYDDCKYFFKIFKTRFGVSPSVFREKNGIDAGDMEDYN